MILNPVTNRLFPLGTQYRRKAFPRAPRQRNRAKRGQ